MRLIAQFIKIDLLDGEVVVFLGAIIVWRELGRLVVEEDAHVFTLVLADGVSVDVVSEAANTITEQRPAVDRHLVRVVLLEVLVVALDALIKDQLSLLFVIVDHVVYDLALLDLVNVLHLGRLRLSRWLNGADCGPFSITHL